uniref:Putative ovule protein n=1 Tax=Solanum chacoense TaxID=4108 RepID=A0A0V0HM77_SOLCH
MLRKKGTDGQITFTAILSNYILSGFDLSSWYQKINLKISYPFSFLFSQLDLGNKCVKIMETSLLLLPRKYKTKGISVY